MILDSESSPQHNDQAQAGASDPVSPAATSGFGANPSVGEQRISSQPDARQGVFLDESATVVGTVIGVNQGTVVTQLPPEIQPPPPPQIVPHIPDFVGREQELAYFAHHLHTAHVAVITGMPGVGKTALATVLAKRTANQERTFWHSFYRGEGIESLIWQLAGFLAWHGKDDLWRVLNGVRSSGGYALPPAVLFDYAIKLLRSQGYLLCLDDFQFVDTDPILEELVERLRPLIAAGELSLIITSRQVPQIVQLAAFDTLGGLSSTDTFTFVAQSGLSLSDDLAMELFKHTDGNVQFLTLAIDTLKRASNPAEVIENLAATDDIERYLLTQVDRDLSDDERDVMYSIAALLGHPGTQDAIEYLLDGARVRRTLSDLSSRRLLRVTEMGSHKLYTEHAIVQDFYYDMLSNHDRRTMHRRAAEFYTTVEPDALKGAEHYRHTGEYARAAEIATADIWATINRGQAQALDHLLEQITPHQVSTGQWVRICLARGQVHGLLGKNEVARSQYQAALAVLENMEATPTSGVLVAQACRGLGELLEQEAPQEALTWLERGLARVTNVSALDEAALCINIGTVEMTLGHYATALTNLAQGLQLLPAGSNQLRSTALMNLAIVHIYQGNIELGNTCAEQALDISQQLQDHFQTAGILSNLGIARYIGGDWHAGVKDFERGLALAQEIGSQKLMTSLETNLGVAFINIGHDEAAQQHLCGAIELAQRNKLPFYEYVAQLKLGDLHIRSGAWEQAKLRLDEAEQLAHRMESQVDLIDVYRLRAEIALGTGDLGTASSLVHRGLALAHELGEEGTVVSDNLRVWGQILYQEGKYEEASAVLERSYGIVAAVDPYEAARTQLQWGRALLARGATSDGLQHIEAARLTFDRLGARRDLALFTTSESG